MAKFSSFGTLLKLGDGGGPEVFTTVAGVQDIEGPSFSLETIDVTAHDSPGAFEEIVPGIKRSGEIGFTLVYDPADSTHNATTGLFSNLSNRTKRNFQVVFTNATPTTMAFAGYVTGWNHSMPVSGALAVEVAIKPTGLPVFTP